MFTVSLELELELELEIESPSGTPVQLLWPMVPWVGKVASGVADAEQEA